MIETSFQIKLNEIGVEMPVIFGVTHEAFENRCH